MKYFTDYLGTKIRFTDERRSHILEHPEMIGMERAIAETLSNPDCVVQSLSDTEAWLYYRYYRKTVVGGKYVCVVVKIRAGNAFVLTAYLTNKIKKGKRL